MAAVSRGGKHVFVVITASNDAQAAAVEREILCRQKSGSYPAEIKFFVVPDPSVNRVGSGGATLNALLTVQDLAGIHPSVVPLEKCLILMIHSGGDSQRLPTQSVCGKAWSVLPYCSDFEDTAAHNAQNRMPSADLSTPIDLLLDQLLIMFKDVPNGLVVASSDVLLGFPEGVSPLKFPSEGASGLAVPADRRIGPNHGVYQLQTPDMSGLGTGLGPTQGADQSPDARGLQMSVGPSSQVSEPVAASKSAELAAPGAVDTRLAVCLPVARYWQKASLGALEANGAVREDGRVLLDSGIIYFAQDVTAKLLELATLAPVHCATYLGVDMALPPVRLELYSDIMMALGHGMGLTREEYENMPSDDAGPLIKKARSILWEQLSGHTFSAYVAESATFTHVGTTAEYIQLLAAPTATQKIHGLLQTAAFYSPSSDVPDQQAFQCEREDRKYMVMNSYLHCDGDIGDGSVVEHCELGGTWHIGRHCLVSSVRSMLDIVVCDNTSIQEVHLQDGALRAFSVLAVDDPIKCHYRKENARVCGVSWQTVFHVASVGPEDIWPGVPEEARSIWTARLFPVLDTLQVGHLDDEVAKESFELTAKRAAHASLQEKAALWLQYLRETGLAQESTHWQQLAASFVQEAVLDTWRHARRVSLKEMLANADSIGEFAWRRRLRGKVDIALLLSCIKKRSSMDVTGLAARVASTCTDELVFFQTNQRESRTSRSGSTSSIATAELTPGVGQPDYYSPESPLKTFQIPSPVLRVGKSAGAEAAHSHVAAAFHGLDALAAKGDFDVAARALAVQSQLLWNFGNWGTTEYRTGPSSHHQWAAALELLGGSAEQCRSQRPKAIAMMAEVRDGWLGRRHLLGRAARHYERASQLLLTQCVFTAPVQAPVAVPVPPMGEWVIVTAPARVDLAGGWSDTPPITFEAQHDEEACSGPDAADVLPEPFHRLSRRGGGLVVNAAVVVDGKRPIGARVRRVQAGPQATVVLRTRCNSYDDDKLIDNDGTDGSVRAAEICSEITLSSVDEFMDFHQPHAGGAIVKCAFISLGLVTLRDEGMCKDGAGTTLTEQLLAVCGGSVEVETWSSLPHGSGLGTSSILAAAVVAALSAIVGKRYDETSVAHLVLKVEQMMSTGGGWQDQVGAQWPGVKLGASAASLPLCVDVHTLGASSLAHTREPLSGLLDAHLALVYTGKTRLAKNLLQKVLRQWHMKENGVVQRVQMLRACAMQMTAALLRHDIEAVGKELSAYWSLKKGMAPMAEPEEATRMIEALGPLIHGCSLAGAGGGGFLVVVTRKPHMLGELRRVLAECPSTQHLAYSVHACAIDNVGMAMHGARHVT